MEKLKGVMRRTESLMYGVKGYLGASPKLQQSMAILTVPKIQCIFPLSCPCIVDVEVDVRHESSHFLVGDGDEAVGGNNAGQAEHQVSPGPYQEAPGNNVAQSTGSILKAMVLRDPMSIETLGQVPG